MNKSTEKVLLSQNGFAIPQILLIGIGLSIGISSMMSTAIFGLNSSRLNRQDLMAKASTFSGMTTIRTLLNENNGDPFYYFWLVKTCTLNVDSCPTNTKAGEIVKPYRKWWADDYWCTGSNNCNGRQKAPMCNYNSKINWDKYVTTFHYLTNGKRNIIESERGNIENDFIQGFEIKSTDYIGTEDYGANSILIEGVSMSTNTKEITSRNRARINIEVVKETPSYGFGFLSAGAYETDGMDSLYLGNLKVTGDKKGSIIWRRNIYSEKECTRLTETTRSSGSNLPRNGNGGIWIQPIGLPKQPPLAKKEDRKIVICNGILSDNVKDSCIIKATSNGENAYSFHALYVRGRKGIFDVSTRDNSKTTLEVMGDIDISDGGVFCHRDGNNVCGSGKPENLTILVKHKSVALKNKLVCNRERGSKGGILVKANERITEFNETNLPGNSINIENTGKRAERFSGFIYGPNATLVSVEPKHKWVQDISNSNKRIHPMIIVTKGVYGWIHDTSSRNDEWESRMSRLILSPNEKLIPYGNNNNDDISVLNLDIIGIGIRGTSGINNSLNRPVNMLLVYNRLSKNYFLRAIDIKKVNKASERNSLVGLPYAVSIMKWPTSLNSINLGRNLENAEAKRWLQIYNINVSKGKLNNTRKFAGAAWVRNLCLDKEGNTEWDFSNSFSKGLEKRYGREFNWGVSYYRGKSILVWKTLMGIRG